MYKWVEKAGAALIDQALFSGTNFAVNVLLTRWLLPAEYGAYAIGFAILVLISGFYNALAVEPTSVFGPDKYRDKLAPYYQIQILMHVAVGLLISLLIGIFTLIYDYVTHDKITVAVFWGLTFGNMSLLLFWFVRRLFYIEHRALQAALHTFAYSIVSLLAIALLHELGNLNPFTAFVGPAILMIPINIVGMRSNGIRLLQVPNLDFKPIFGENWHYGKWLLGAGFLVWMSGNAYLILVGSLLPLSVAGALKAVQNLLFPIRQIIAAIGLLFLPWASRQFSLHGADNLKKNILMFSIGSVIMTCVYYLLVVLFIDPIFDLLYGSNFNEYKYIAPYLGLVPIFFAFSSAYSVGLRVAKKTKYVLFADIIGSLLVFTVGIGLITEFGIMGAVVGMLLSTGSRLPVLLILWRSVSNSIPNEQSTE